MSLPLFLVDAFTEKAFAGNPAAVCLLPEWKEDRWLQSLAAEMNQAETAYLVRTSAGYDLRWFTPKVEVELCGHATLASAKVLWHEKLVGNGDTISFATQSGILKAAQRGSLIELDFPVKPCEQCLPPAGLAQALGIAAPTFVGKSKFDYLVEVASEEILRKAAPDFRALASLPVRGTILTACSSSPRFDFVSRFFAPACGIDEDPVTGSAHCTLADYWKQKLGRDELTGFQASSRGGVVHTRVQSDRVLLGGHAVIVTKGELIGG
jgi:PhzF family phenazine biosynthesis protein